MQAQRAAKVELPFQEWPEADRRAWEALFAAGDVLEDAGAGRHWAAATRVTNRQHYGRWLAWLSAAGALDDRRAAVGAGHARAGAPLRRAPPRGGRATDRRLGR